MAEEGSAVDEDMGARPDSPDGIFGKTRLGWRIKNTERHLIKNTLECIYLSFENIK